MTLPLSTISGIQLSNDSGADATDFVTNVAAQTITATLSSALGSGETVWGLLDNGIIWTDITNKVSGTTLSWNGATLSAGSSSIQLKVTDAAGNDGTVATQSYTLDNTRPAITLSGLSLSSDTGTSNTDRITKTASQTIKATLSSALDGTDTVWGSLDNGSTWTNITNQVSGTALSWNGASLSVGSSTIQLKVTDAAGNESALSFADYTLDTSAPTTTISSVAFSHDSGTSSTDWLTNMASQTVSGSLSANLMAGDTVYVSLDNGATWSGASTTVGQSTWSLQSTLTASGNLKVKVTDAAGNDGTVTTQGYTFDTTAPTTTFSGLWLSADTGSSNTDRITHTASQSIFATLSGALTSGDIVYGSVNNGVNWTNITDKVSGTTLSWNGATLSADSSTIQLKVTDAAGNDGAVATQGYTLDTTPPGTPNLQLESDTGVWYDNITNDNTPALSGTAEAGSNVSIYEGITFLGTTFAAGGAWYYTTATLSAGNHSFTVIATDAAGNDSGRSASLNITIDTSAPSINSVSVPVGSTYGEGSALDFTVNFDEVVRVNTSGGAPSVALTIGSSIRAATYDSGSGTSTLKFRYTVVNGDSDADGITIGALTTNGGSIQDVAGNAATLTLNGVGSAANIRVDGSIPRPPYITSVTASTPDGVYAADTTIAITVHFSSAVDVNTAVGSPTLALSSGGSATYASGTGTSALTFNYIVAAGQNSADLDYRSGSALDLGGATIKETGGAQRDASLTAPIPGAAGSLGANQNLVIDTTAPTNTVAGAAFSADTGSSASDFITHTAAQTISGRLTSNLAAGEQVDVSIDNGASWSPATTTTGSSTWSLAGQTLTGSGALKVRVSDGAGNHGSEFTQSYTLDTSAPAWQSVTITGNTMVLRYTESSQLDAANPPNATAFTVNVAGSTVVVANVTVNAAAKTVTLILASAVTAGQAVTVAYTDPSAGDDTQSIQDTAGNDATSLTATGVTNLTPTPSPAPAPAATVIDGIAVQSQTASLPGGGTGTQLVIPVVTAGRTEDHGASSLADIPLVSANGQSVLLAQVPTGLGLTAVGGPAIPAASALQAFIAAIEAASSSSSPTQQNQLTVNGTTFLNSLPAGNSLLLQTITPNTDGHAAPGATLVLSSGGDASLHTALVINALQLPRGTGLLLQHIDFAAIVGSAVVTGGAGQNFVVGDAAAQTIFLGADDDELHGGGGDDTVGSMGGNDRLFGDDGNDVVFGGIGNDMLSGGAGNDRLNGGLGWDSALQSGSRADYRITQDGATLVLTHTATGDVDRLSSVEVIQFDTGKGLYVASSDAQAAFVHIVTHWLGRELTSEEGLQSQQWSGKSVEAVAQSILAGAESAKLAGKTVDELLAGWQSSERVVRVDASHEYIAANGYIDSATFSSLQSDSLRFSAGQDGRWEGIDLRSGAMVSLEASSTPGYSEAYYLASKLAQLRETEPQDARWQQSDAAATATLREAIAAIGLTPQQHFAQFGLQEQTSTNPWFDPKQYLANKVQQLNTNAEQGRSDWTAQDVLSAVQASGMTLWTHYQLYGWREEVASSKLFNAQQYFQDKLQLLQTRSPEEQWTMASMKDAFAANHYSPIDHYVLHGQKEGVEVTVVGTPGLTAGA